MNHAPGAVTPLDPELTQVGDAIGQRRGLLEGAVRPEGAENLCNLGKCLAERGWAFGAWPAGGALPGGGMILGLWA